MPTDRPPVPSVFLEAAAAELGRPEATAPGRWIEVLAAIGRLCDLAGRADAARAIELLAGAAALCDGLRAAARAAELMLIDARATLAAVRGEPARPGGPTTPTP